MAIQKTNITADIISITIGVGSNDIGTLCTSNRINPWARYKPGYLYSDANNYIQFQPPRGLGNIDPRGAYLGNAYEGYNMGDYGGYNHQATAPNTPALGNIVYGSSSAGAATSRSIPFYIGEIDWQGAEATTHNAKQNLAIPLPYVHLVVNGASVGNANISAIAQNGSVNIPINYTIPAAGSQTTLNYEVWLGIDSTHFNVRVGTLAGANSAGSFTAITLNVAQLTGVSWDYSAITGGTIPTYTNFQIYGTQHNFFTSPNILNFEFVEISPFEALNGNSVLEYFRAISADCYVKGFYSSPNTLYSAGNKTLYGNNADNQITLPVGGSPSSYGEGDIITLVLSNINLGSNL